MTPPKPLLLFGGLIAISASILTIRSDFPAFKRTSTAGITSFAPMLEKVLPGVVSIKVSSTRTKAVPLAQIASMRMTEAPVASDNADEMIIEGGSGTIIDAKRGLIYTNQHVVRNASRVTVKLADGHEVVGTVLGADIGSDVAVVQIDAKNLKSVPFGNSDTLRVGDLIVIAGSPYGLAGTAKMGMVSAMMRSDVAPEIFEDFVQIDAIINPGNSGGAMVNTRGELVGVIAASVGAAGETAIGFVIPINMVRSISDQIVAGGMVRRGSIGFGVQPVTPQIVKDYDLPFAKGAVIMAAAPGSPAAKSAFKPYDVIVGVNNRPIVGPSDYMARIASIPVGKSVELDVYSKGRVRRAKFEVADLTIEPTPMAAPDDIKSIAGLTLGMLLPGATDYGKVRGARVLAVAQDSAAAKLGLMVDDVITKIDGAAVGAVEDAFALIRGKTAVIRIELTRQGRPAYFDFTP